jgi:hypothetical protein
VGGKVIPGNNCFEILFAILSTPSSTNCFACFAMEVDTSYRAISIVGFERITVIENKKISSLAMVEDMEIAKF